MRPRLDWPRFPREGRLCNMRWHPCNLISDGFIPFVSTASKGPLTNYVSCCLCFAQNNFIPIKLQPAHIDIKVHTRTCSARMLWRPLRCAPALYAAARPGPPEPERLNISLLLSYYHYHYCHYYYGDYHYCYYVL